MKLNPYVSVSTSTINGLVGPHVLFTGANVHVRSGSGHTNDTCVPLTCGNALTLTGLGNLAVGYNEAPVTAPPLVTGDRSGSHNLIAGDGHRYPKYGGLVAGIQNNISGEYASASGGGNNTASGFNSSVSGGAGNTASGEDSSVSGGAQRSAGQLYNWAAGALFQAQ